MNPWHNAVSYGVQIHDESQCNLLALLYTYICMCNPWMALSLTYVSTPQKSQMTAKQRNNITHDFTTKYIQLNSEAKNLLVLWKLSIHATLDIVDIRTSAGIYAWAGSKWHFLMYVSLRIDCRISDFWTSIHDGRTVILLYTSKGYFIIVDNISRKLTPSCWHLFAARHVFGTWCTGI